MARARCWMLVLTVHGLLLAAQAWAAPTIDDFLRRPEFENVQISPGGEYFAMTLPLEDRSVLVITSRADGRVTTTLNPGGDGFIDDVAWVSDERVVVAWSRRFGTLSEPYAMPALHTVDVHGRGKREFWGRIVDPMLRDPERVLVLECIRETRHGCMTRLTEIGVVKRGKERHLVDGPVVNARFMVNREGAPVFSWAQDEDDRQLLFLRRDGAWERINGEVESGVVVNPLAVDDDLRHGYLWSERRTGPDVIERIDLGTGRRTVVGSHPEMDPASVVWSFDLREAIGVRYGRGITTTHWFDGAHPHVPMYRLLENEFPGMAIRVTSATRDGRLAVLVASSDREPGSYHLLDIVTGDMRPLFEHREWLDRRMLAAKQPVVFDSREGGRLDGYLTRPLVEPAGGAPLVVLVHGGPYGVRDSWVFDPEVQMLAAHGYAVLQVNFRGSSGKGREFIEAGYRQWGRGMIDDIVDGVRWARVQPGISPSRACIWGASYGGYAALMASVREPDMFACAIGMAGPYDLPTMLRWGDVQRTRHGRNLLEQYIGSDVAALVADSPSSHAGVIKASLMIAQGGRDRRVSPEHMRAMTRALDRAGKPYQLFNPRNETHGFHDDGIEREYYVRVFAFLAQHLPPSPPAADAQPVRTDDPPG